jgi:hypothetical protein
MLLGTLREQWLVDPGGMAEHAINETLGRQAKPDGQHTD